MIMGHQLRRKNRKLITIIITTMHTRQRPQLQAQEPHSSIRTPRQRPPSCLRSSETISAFGALRVVVRNVQEKKTKKKKKKHFIDLQLEFSPLVLPNISLYFRYFLLSSINTKSSDLIFTRSIFNDLYFILSLFLRFNNFHPRSWACLSPT